MTEQEKLEEISREMKIEQVRKEMNFPRKNSFSMKKKSELKDEKRGKGFQIRLLLASVLFLAFLVSKQEGFCYNEWNCDKIMQMVQYDVGVDLVEDKIISVFNRLN